MAEFAERHEIQVRGHDGTIVFTADSRDGRLVIRQIPDGRKSKDVCSITLADPDELRAFFKGLRKIIASLGHGPDLVAENEPATAASRRAIGQRQIGQHQIGQPQHDDDREAMVAQAREKNAQAFAPWTKQEEQEVNRRLNRERTCNTSRTHTNGHHVP
jgi:hypothetical protein